MKKVYTIAMEENDITSDIIFETSIQAELAAIADGMRVFSFIWDGVDIRSAINIEEI